MLTKIKPAYTSLMKIKFSLLLACITLTHFACKKTETTGDQPVTPPTAKLKLLTKATAKNGSNTSTTTYTYDSNKRLVSIMAGTSETVFTYNDRGELLLRSSGPLASRIELIPTYEDGRIRYVISRGYKNSVIDNERKYGYVYSSDGNVIEIDQNYGNLREVTYKLDYAGGNCIKFTSDDPTFGFYSEYTYDDKKSPNYSSNARFILGLLTGPFPVHNILTAKTTYTYAANSPSPTTNSATFTYDADGYPVTATQGSSTVTYEYTEF